MTVNDVQKSEDIASVELQKQNIMLDQIHLNISSGRGAYIDQFSIIEYLLGQIIVEILDGKHGEDVREMVGKIEIKVRNKKVLLTQSTVKLLSTERKIQILERHYISNKVLIGDLKVLRDYRNHLAHNPVIYVTETLGAQYLHSGQAFDVNECRDKLGLASSVWRELIKLTANKSFIRYKSVIKG